MAWLASWALAFHRQTCPFDLLPLSRFLCASYTFTFKMSEPAPESPSSRKSRYSKHIIVGVTERWAGTRSSRGC